MTGVHALEADSFQALAHPAGLRPLALLGTRQVSVGELQALRGGEGDTTPRHLRAPRGQGLVERPKDGTSAISQRKDVRGRTILRLAREMIGGRLAEGGALLGRLAREAPNATRT